jgi:hypothetical protein
MSDHIERKLVSAWPDPAERERARAELSRYGTEPYEREVDRVRLAILRLCEGRLERLAEWVAEAKNDYRDVLVAAEYPAEGEALWALHPDLSEEERRRLEELRERDRVQYEKWLKE